MHLAPKGSFFNLAQGQVAVPSTPHFLQLYYFSTETVKTIPLSFTLYVIDLLHVGLGMEIINSALLFKRYHSFQADRPPHNPRSLSEGTFQKFPPLVLWCSYCLLLRTIYLRYFSWQKINTLSPFLSSPPFINLTSSVFLRKTLYFITI